jgi:hypothetical protein
MGLLLFWFGCLPAYRDGGGWGRRLNKYQVAATDSSNCHFFCQTRKKKRQFNSPLSKALCFSQVLWNKWI